MIDPSTNQPYTPSPAYFLGCFDIYDREETLGEELEKFDPNNPVDREVLIVNYSLTERWRITYRQKYLLYKSLEEALRDSSYDFQALLEHDSQVCSSFPNGWDAMANPRVFFEDIYRLASEIWKDDLRKAETEDKSTWEYI
ncbi:hypothetical protein LOY35_20695 [Pseudomonas sp. B21-028]|uniref:hypothetical protein n=1 Tax=Pseudomonas sp. B21-028 TaxID=2895480 RepID=UPI00216014A1|nr:hypothetical protein [Pseudomonas sp. B21-028]UVL82604.1 hypothetical protein LOY35_20695 [Pseudomonas sp. B21-028]